VKQLIHHGIYIPQYFPLGLKLKFKGKVLILDSEAEQMAIAFAKKFSTNYANDPLFVSNFLEDFSKKLRVSGSCKVEDFDWSDVTNYLERERKRKESLTREEKKMIAEERKKTREALIEKYGYAIVDGKRIVLQNWIVEPPGLFTSKGRNPLRGRWKKEIRREEITLNLSEKPDGLDEGWKEIVWRSNCMWIASWRSPINGKMKYVWFSPKSSIRQNREIKKWNKAFELKSKIKDVERHIRNNINQRDVNKRKIATVVYLIKESGIRVGDEKIAGEMGTVGCTTLKAENLKIDGNKVYLNFVGKDYVYWQRELTLPNLVVKNIQKFKNEAGDGLIFDGINSQKVAKFLQEVVPDVSAKTFRTMIAGITFKNAINETHVHFKKGEFENTIRFKYVNLAVAKRLNHKRKLMDKFEEKLKKREEKMKLKKTEYEDLLTKFNKADLKDKEKIKMKEDKAEESAHKALLEYQLYKDTLEWNLNTSLTSYIDPRLVIEYAKKKKVPIEHIYSKSLREKFSWALLENDECKNNQ
jgi:DNA topoisomerase-1